MMFKTPLLLYLYIILVPFSISLANTPSHRPLAVISKQPIFSIEYNNRELLKEHNAIQIIDQMPSWIEWLAFKQYSTRIDDPLCFNAIDNVRSKLGFIRLACYCMYLRGSDTNDHFISNMLSKNAEKYLILHNYEKLTYTHILEYLWLCVRTYTALNTYCTPDGKPIKLWQRPQLINCLDPLFIICIWKVLNPMYYISHSWIYQLCAQLENWLDNYLAYSPITYSLHSFTGFINWHLRYMEHVQQSRISQRKLVPKYMALEEQGNLYILKKIKLTLRSTYIRKPQFKDQWKSIGFGLECYPQLIPGLQDMYIGAKFHAWKFTDWTSTTYPDKKEWGGLAALTIQWQFTSYWAIQCSLGYKTFGYFIHENLNAKWCYSFLIAFRAHPHHTSSAYI